MDRISLQHQLQALLSVQSLLKTPVKLGRFRVSPSMLISVRTRHQGQQPHTDAG